MFSIRGVFPSFPRKLLIRHQKSIQLQTQYLSNEPPPQEELGFRQKMKLMLKKYFFPAAVIYSVSYLSLLGGLYLGISNNVGLVIGLDYPALLIQACDNLTEFTGNPTYSNTILSQDPRYGQFAVSIFLNEFLEPLRWIAVALGTPKFAKFLSDRKNKTSPEH